MHTVTAMDFLWVALGSALGGLLRFAIGLAISGIGGTLLINVMGSGLLGYLAAQSTESPLRLLGTVGFCGGFTTFSTFSLQLLGLLQQGRWGLALGYVAASLGLSLAAVAVGFYGGRRG